MKTFNKVIKVEVGVDSIASKLLATMNSDEKHAELVVESIIGSMLASRTSDLQISSLFNALNGYNNDINFEVNDEVLCTSKDYIYGISSEAESGYSREYIKIGSCKVVEIDLYATDKLTIEYSAFDSKGQKRAFTKVVNHATCSKIDDIV